MAKIGEARHNEFGKITGGVNGDQTKEEVCIAPFRNEFTIVYRAKDPAKQALLCSAMIQACRNDNIGYGQEGDVRYTMYKEMLKTGNISLIDVPCGTDCSQLVADCCIIVGIPVSPYMYTGDEDTRLMATGQFEKITKFTEDELKVGDILWRVGHTAIVVEESPKAEYPSKQPKWVGKVTTLLNVRVKPNAIAKKYSAWPLLGEGNLIDVCDTSENGKWYYVRIAGVHFAWVSASYVIRA